MLNLEQNSPEWLEFRKNKIGASDAPIIVGDSPWTTPYQLWEQKLGIAPPRSANWAMQRGHDMEETARKEYEHMTGHVVMPQVMQHAEHDWMIASLDGIDLTGKHAVEIKTTSREDHLKTLGGHVIRKYFAQLQHQIEVAELESIDMFSFCENEGVVLKIYRDQKYINAMLKKEKTFWDMMQDFEAPPLGDKDFVECDDDVLAQLVLKWREVKCKLELIKNFKAEEEELREALISRANGRNLRTHGIEIKRVISAGRVNYKNIPELECVDLNQYRGSPVESWRITEK
jgi:putative phage-type endonuclease